MAIGRGTARAGALGLCACALLAPARPSALELRFTHAAPAAAAGYRAFVGAASGAYGWWFDLGRPAPSSDGVFIASLPIWFPPGSRLYIALAAYDTRGQPSVLSNELVVMPLGSAGPDDGVANDGDGSGVPGDAPCTDGFTQGCDDNCPFAPNGPEFGTCIAGDPPRRGLPCHQPLDCGAGGSCSLRQEDRDGDGHGDSCDVCPYRSDPLQLDADRDGFGDACDADYDADAVVTTADLALFARALGSRWGEPAFDARLDHDGSGAITNADWSLAWGLLGTPPGPSLLRCAGEGGCAPAACPSASSDWDGDGIGDSCDLCPYVGDPLQLDLDGDGIGERCDGGFSP